MNQLTELLSLGRALEALAVAIGLLAAFYLLSRVLHQRSELRRRQQQLTTAQQELAAIQRELRGMEREHRFLTQFVRELPHLSQELHSRLTLRRLPELLLEMMNRVFAPKQALVILRRRGAEAGSDGVVVLHVVGVTPRGSTIRLGTEIRIGEGELGFVAETQRVMSREDFQKESSFSFQEARRHELTGFRVDLAAPMVFDEATLGLLAISGPRESSVTAKEVLRLIAQLGALTYYNVFAYRQMKRHADLDRLTGLQNKASIVRTLSEEILEAEKRGSQVSVLLFDIDHFKHYNDQHGHLAGDNLLAELAGLVREMVRAEDSAGRFGGEEFLLILPDTEMNGAMAVAEKIRQRIAEHRFPHADKQPLGILSVSGGVAQFPGHALESSGLLRLADKALYEAKELGRNRFLAAKATFFGPETD